MKKLFKGIVKLVFFIVFVLFVMTGIDYYRMRNGLVPIFNNSNYNSKTRIQTYKGVFYEATRQYFASVREPLEESSDIHFYLFTFPLPLPSLKKDVDNSYQIKSEEVSNCSQGSYLYYADLNQKVYFYCISGLTIKDNGKTINTVSSDVIDRLKDKMDFMGLLKDQTTMYFQLEEGDVSPLGLSLYQCNSFNVNDVYIGPKNMTFNDDFCTYKDDDFKFIYTIVDETPDNIQEVVDEEGNVIFETFYEDDIYYYQFNVPKSGYIFVETPEVRGKAATKTPLSVALSTGLITIKDLEEKGITFDSVKKVPDPVGLD